MVVASAALQPLPGWSAEGTARVEVGRDGERVLVVDVEDGDDEDGFREVWLLRPDVSGLVSLGTLTGSSGRFDLPAGLDLDEFSVVDVSLEQFDGIAQWRTDDNGNPVGEEVTLFDGTKVTGPTQLREWLVKGYSDAFIEVAAEKMLIYALGRGMDYQDMPMVRAVARQAKQQDSKFSALVLAVVKTDAFQKNMKGNDAAAPKQAAAETPRQTASR